MKVAIFGTGENGFQAYHILRHDPNVEIIGFLDDDVARHGQEMLGVRILGDMSVIPALMERQAVDGAIVAVGDNHARKMLTTRLRATGLPLVSAVHPQAIIDSPARIGEGVIIEMGVAIHPGASIGDGVFLGGGCVISHHSVVGDFALIAGGVIFGGRVAVGALTLVGVAAAIQPHVTIGSNVVVGVGAAVTADLPNDVVAVGVPAKVIRQRSPVERS